MVLLVYFNPYHIVKSKSINHFCHTKPPSLSSNIFEKNVYQADFVSLLYYFYCLIIFIKTFYNDQRNTVPALCLGTRIMTPGPVLIIKINLYNGMHKWSNLFICCSLIFLTLQPLTWSICIYRSILYQMICSHHLRHSSLLMINWADHSIGLNNCLYQLSPAIYPWGILH